MNQDRLNQIIQTALAEDIGTGDITSVSTIHVDAEGEFALVAREEMIFAGAVILNLFHDLVKSSRNKFGITLLVEDGDKVKPGQKIGTLKGNVREILKIERVLLNFLQHLSGIATITNKFVQEVSHTKCQILDTRKTTPGLRELEKYAVKCGGGENHRMGLYDMVLIKDNHIAHAGSVGKAVKKAQGQGVKVEVECDTIQQVKEALAANADIIMCDNMSVMELKEAVELAGGKIPLEASGGINLKTVKLIAETGVDFISTGAITQSATAVDIGLDDISD